MTSVVPQVFVTHFLVQKEGSTEAECEDAISFRPEIEPDDAVTDPLCVAVSDGASESLLATRWSRWLVKHAAEMGERHRELFEDTGLLAKELVRRAMDPWDEEIAKYIKGRTTAGKPVQWYEQPGLAKGAFATLLSVRLDPVLGPLPEDPAADAPVAWQWHAAALGDSCLFHISNGSLNKRFPVTSSGDFGNVPQLLGSRNGDVTLIAERMEQASGQLRDGDELLLATDALAAWFLRRVDEGTHPWVELGNEAGQGPDNFDRWVRNQRAGKLMGNDDVAFVRVVTRVKRSQ